MCEQNKHELISRTSEHLLIYTYSLMNDGIDTEFLLTTLHNVTAESM